MQKQYRQGDVFLRQVERLPEEAKQERRQERIILAYGEVTGHTHSVSTLDAQLFVSGAHEYLVVEAVALLVHEEHDTIEIPSGVYEIVRQREYAELIGFQYVSD